MSITPKEMITQLTPVGVHGLLEGGKKGIVVQILEPEPIANQKADMKSLKFKVFISDGASKHKAVLGNEAAATFSEIGSPDNCVVRVNELMTQNAQSQKRLVIITKIDIVNADVSEVVGKPLEYQDWLSNGKPIGSNQIPPKYLPTVRNQNASSAYQAHSTANTSAPPNNGPYTGMRANNTMDRSSTTNQELYPSGGMNRTTQPIQNAAPNGGYSGSTAGRNFTGMNPANSTGGGMNSGMGGGMNSMGGGMNNQFQQGNQKNTYGGAPNSFNKNMENIPPANQQKPQQKKQGSISYLNSNQYKVPENEFLSVNQLAPYTPFVIKVRITSKSDLRTFKKGTGENQVFSADLIDKEGNEITASFFGDAAQLFYPQLEENAVYVMKDGNVKMVNSKFNKKNNDYQIVFDRQDASAITRVDNDAGILVNKFEFVKINAIVDMEVNAIIDIAGFVKEAGQCSEIMLRKTNEMKDRRVLSIYDDSNTLVELTLWGEVAKNIDVNPGQLILIKSARISEFGGAKSLSTSFGTKIFTDPSQMPDDPALRQLKEWKAKECNDQQLNSISGDGGSMRRNTPYTIEEINTALTSISDKAFFDVTAFVSHIKTEGSNLYYPGCANHEKCARKAIPTDDNSYKCDNCNITFQQPVYRYTLSIKLSDHTGSMWINAFDKVAAVIVGAEANTIKMLKESDETRMIETFRDALHKEYNFKILAKNELYESNTRVRVQATRVEKISYAKHSKDILNLLNEYANK